MPSIAQFAGASPDKTQLKNIHGKGNLHLGDNFVLNYTFVKAQKTKQGRGASATRPPATTFNQGGPSGFHTVKAQYTLNDNNYVEASYNNTPLGFFLEPQGGRDIQVAFDLATGLWGNSYGFYDTDRPLKNIRVDGNSYMAGADVDHEIKYGYSYRSAGVNSIWGSPGRKGGSLHVWSCARATVVFPTPWRQSSSRQRPPLPPGGRPVRSRLPSRCGRSR